MDTMTQTVVLITYSVVTNFERMVEETLDEFYSIGINSTVLANTLPQTTFDVKFEFIIDDDDYEGYTQDEILLELGYDCHEFLRQEFGGNVIEIYHEMYPYN